MRHGIPCHMVACRVPCAASLEVLAAAFERAVVLAPGPNPLDGGGYGCMPTSLPGGRRCMLRGSCCVLHPACRHRRMKRLPRKTAALCAKSLPRQTCPLRPSQSRPLASASPLAPISSDEHPFSTPHMSHGMPQLHQSQRMPSCPIGSEPSCQHHSSSVSSHHSLEQSSPTLHRSLALSTLPPTHPTFV
jgi:hypothetical protein